MVDCFNCPKGATEKQHLLENEESIFAAVDKFANFIKLCKSTCAFKNKDVNNSSSCDCEKI